MAELLLTWPACPSHMPRDERDKQPTDTGSQPEDTFALVGHEIRVEIIQVLGRNELSLSELRSGLDMDIEPSRLHYHLQQLVGHFVEKTDKVYRLNSVGIRLSRNLRAGSLDRREEQVTIEADFECYYCQGRVKAIFNKGTIRMVCPECDHLYVKHDSILPLDAFEVETEAFAHFSQYLSLMMYFLSHNVCPSCAYRLRPTFRSTDRDDIQKVVIDKFCELCGASWVQVVGMALLTDPELIAFCYDHGVDILSTPFWELEFAATDKHVTVRSTDPWEVSLEVTFDVDTLELVVDGDLNVLERNRLNTHDEKGTALLDEVLLPENDACFQALRRHRWPDGVVCTICSSQDTVKIGVTPKDAQRYQCQNCDSTFNDLTGTIFADRRFSLPEMFYIIRQMDEENIKQIGQQIERSYKPVLSFVHEVQDTDDEDLEFNL